jgi:RNA polymerase sigma-70 factor, ECF subfamily
MPEPANDHDFGEYRDYLMVLARSQISVDLRCRIDPSDLVQETLCDAFREPTPGHRRGRVQMMGWLKRVLHDNLVDRFRRHKLEVRIESLEAQLDDTGDGISRFLWASQSGPSSRIVREEDALIVTSILAKLPQAQAEAIVLKHCEGMSVAKISRHMNRTPDAVGGLLRHGMCKLRELVPREG